MRTFNLNDFAVAIAQKEGGKVNLPIAQVKEVIKLVLRHFKTFTVEEMGEVLKRQK